MRTFHLRFIHCIAVEFTLVKNGGLTPWQLPELVVNEILFLSIMTLHDIIFILGQVSQIIFMLLSIFVAAAEGPHQVVGVVLHLELLKLIVLLLGTTTVVHVHFGLGKFIYMFSTEFLDVKKLPSIFKYLHYF